MVFASKRGLAGLLTLCCVMAVGPELSADPGDGLRSENGWKLVPALSLGASYNSNLFRATPREDEPVVHAPRGQIEPSISLGNPDARSLRLKFNGSARWDEYFESLAGGQGDGQAAVDGQSGLSAAGNAQATFNPEGDVSLQLSERLSRHNEPPLSRGAEAYNWWQNQAGATLGLHPNDRVLQANLGYDWSWYNYTTDALDDLDRNEHDFRFDGEWRFLPKTSFLAEANYGLTNWEERSRTPARPGIGGEIRNVDSRPLRLRGGVSGLLTNRIALRALAGYGWSMHQVDSSFEGIIGEGALAFTFGDLEMENTLEVGYRRDFSDATVGNYYTSHELFAELDQGLFDRYLTAYLGARFQLRNYSFELEEVDRDASGELRDELLIGRTGLRADPTDWWSFDLAYDLRANFTDDAYSIDAVDPQEPDVAVLREYAQHTVTLTTTFRY